MSDARRHGRRAFKVIMRSLNFNTPNYDLPLHIQPLNPPSLFGAFSTQVPHHATSCIPGPHERRHVFPLNDKLLHLFCLDIATGVFYCHFDVRERVEFDHILLCLWF
jgi:hypothetical protein